MGTVLIATESEVIGMLMTQLAELAGHRVVRAADDERPADSIVRLRPDIVLADIDIGEAQQVLMRRASDTRTCIIYFASASSSPELREYAELRHAPHFPLPAGPAQLRVLIARVLESGVATPAESASPSPTSPPPPHPQLRPR